VVPAPSSVIAEKGRRSGIECADQNPRFLRTDQVRAQPWAEPEFGPHFEALPLFHPRLWPRLIDSALKTQVRRCVDRRLRRRANDESSPLPRTPSPIPIPAGRRGNLRVIMKSLKAVAIGLAASLSLAAAAQTTLVVRDAFGRDVTTKGIVLLDWDGYMANPAVKLTVEAKWVSEYPVQIAVSSNCARLMASREDGDRRGIGARISQQSENTPATIWVSIFPDRDGKDEDFRILIAATDRANKSLCTVEVPVHVIDQDRPHASKFKFHLEYGEDRTGFFKPAKVQSILRQAADDWSFFIDDMSLDSVKAGDEKTDVWNPDGFISTRTATNRSGYAGFLLYFVGIAGEEVRSGGAPSHLGRRQTSKGKELPLLRSGCVDVEMRGNYHQLGWFYEAGDEFWWCSGNLADEPADFYSIMLHEMGHALAFEETYPTTAAAFKSGLWADIAVRKHLGKDPIYSKQNHFPGTIDPESKFGIFGAEYDAQMRVRRWLITKTHLMLLQSVGYKLRRVSCFEVLNVSYPAPAMRVGSPATIKPKASGGIPAYRWEIARGSLPAGLALDEFTGAIAGTPVSAAPYQCVVRVTDQSPQAQVVEVPLAGEVKP
jgi:hypothetical protein